jgi:hypothetical protein
MGNMLQRCGSVRWVWLICVVWWSVAAVEALSPSTAGPQPPRDTSAQKDSSQKDAALGRVSGRVFAADSGRPLKRARIMASSAELPQGRAALTDDNGAYELGDLPGGRYTVTVSKTGFISLSYGQRRPLQAGTPLQVGDGQQLKGIDFRLPRGGAIAGRIADEDGEPMPGATVHVMRYQYVQGDRRLVPAGTGQTDDKGQYRVWGLMPGAYYVTATARGFGLGGPRVAGAGSAGRAGGGRGRSDELEVEAYAPTYFPGVGSAAEATPVSLDMSQEALDISFSLQLVRTARVSGRVAKANGAPANAGNVSLTTEEAAGGGRGQIGMNYSTRIQSTGTFQIAGVPPGRYILRARGIDGERPQFAQQPLVVTGGDVSGISVLLVAGGTITGSISFQPTQTTVPSDLTQVRVSAPSTDQSAFGANPTARVDNTGRFTLDGVPAGPHLIRSNGAPRGWTLTSVTINGREVIDTPIEVRGGETITSVALTFTDKVTQISGRVTSEQGAPLTDYTVLAFPADEALWRPQARQIMTARPDQNGKFEIQGLPAGDYYLALVDPAEQGEWFDPSFLQQHRAGAFKVALGEGESKMKDFRIKN